MGNILLLILAGLFAIFIVLGVLILREQKKLETPPGGMLLVDKRDPEGKPVVYFQALDDPANYLEGQQMVIKVLIFDESSQQSQRS